MRGIIFTAISIMVLQPIAVLASTVVVQTGDTMSEIAERNNVTLRELMRHNQINDANKLKVGQKLKIPGEKKLENSDFKIYKVSKGDSINSIAILFSKSINEIISINGINDSDYLYIGQEIKIPIKRNKGKGGIHLVSSGETIKEIADFYDVSKSSIISYNNLTEPNKIFPGQKLLIPKNKVDFVVKSKNPLYHKVKQGETLSGIANEYKIPISEVIKMNNINNPSKLYIGQKIYLKSKIKEKTKIAKVETNKTNKSDWRNYGPLRLDWTKWQSLGGSYVTKTINEKGQVLYLAINCGAKKINSTGVNGTWKNWIEPIEKFEKNLINDLCKNKKS